MEIMFQFLLYSDSSLCSPPLFPADGAPRHAADGAEWSDAGDDGEDKEEGAV